MEQPKSKAKLPKFIAGNCGGCALSREDMRHPTCRECSKVTCSRNPRPNWRQGEES